MLICPLSTFQICSRQVKHVLGCDVVARLWDDSGLVALTLFWRCFAFGPVVRSLGLSAISGQSSAALVPDKNPFMSRPSLQARVLF